MLLPGFTPANFRQLRGTYISIFCIDLPFNHWEEWLLRSGTPAGDPSLPLAVESLGQAGISNERLEVGESRWSLRVHQKKVLNTYETFPFHGNQPWAEKGVWLRGCSWWLSVFKTQRRRKFLYHGLRKIKNEAKGMQCQISEEYEHQGRNNIWSHQLYPLSFFFPVEGWST